MTVGRLRSASRHCSARSGHAGSPSSITIEVAQQQRADQRVPHHPRGGGEPLQALAGPEVPAQALVLVVLHELAAVAVDDRLGQPGGPRGEQHVERVVERHRLELAAAPPRRAGQTTPPRRAPRPRRRAPRPRAPGSCRRPRMASTSASRLDVAVAEAVAADGQHHLGLDLGEAVDDAARPELRRAGGPDGSQRRGGDERHERLGDVRHVGDDAVAGADPEPLQAGAGARHLLAQLAEGHLELRPGLGVGDHRHRVGVLVAADQMLGVVEPRAGEPHRARHLARGQHPLERGVGAELEEVPDRAPEALQILDRPSPQRRRSRRTAGRSDAPRTP